MSPISKDVFVIEGMGKEGFLKGEVKVGGAKNAALKAMAASVLFDGPVTLKNIPTNDDVITMSKVLTKLGAKVEKKGDNEYVIDPAAVNSTLIDSDLAKGMRASVVLTGPLLSRFGKAVFPAPGGCVIGTRPIDQFIIGYDKLGAKTVESDNLYRIEGKLKGAEIFFNVQTVGGTETMMMAAVMTEGKTVLKNCAMEPEIVNVAEWLNQCGAKIFGAGTTTMTIEGTSGKLLDASKAAYTAIPDRIEAGSYLILGALLGKDMKITDCEPKHMESVIALLLESGAKITTSEKTITVSAPSSLKAFNVRTHEYPGFPTDLQAPLVTLLTQAEGESTVVETIFEGRFKYVEDLQNMGASITVMNPREIIVKGPKILSELPVDEELRAHDIRAGFAIVAAALCGTGKFKVNNVHFIDRGYEKLEEKLSSLGANIARKIK